MNQDAALRQQLVKLLTKSEAHAGFDQAVKQMPAALQGEIPPGAEHSPWQLLEHLRIALWDIVEFSRNPEHKSPPWPQGYWPKQPAPASPDDWDKSAQAYRQHLQEMCDLINDKSKDLFATFAHGDGQTILREALLAADHSAYHIGQLVMVRRLLGAWK